MRRDNWDQLVRAVAASRQPRSLLVPELVRTFLWLKLVYDPVRVSEVVNNREELAGLIGKRITIRGIVTRTKVPTIIGVDIDAAHELADHLGEATGTLATYTIAPEPPVSSDGEAVVAASRSPGTYYVLRDGDGLAKARAAK